MFSWLKETSRPAAPLTLNIEVDGQRTFTTRERITGRLTIKTLTDSPFDKLEIKLHGVSRTYGRRVVPRAPNARTVTTTHRFLDLAQPDLGLYFPDDKIFKSGHEYSFPFEFAIPDRMLPATCRHVVQYPWIHEHHTSMPPSLGDRQPGEATDYAPRKVSVKYRIVARVYKAEGFVGQGKLEMLACCSKRIRFLPSDAVPKLAPEASTRIDHVRGFMPLKKLWAKRLGNLGVASTQASTFLVRKVHSGMWHSQLSGQIKLQLMFVPAFDGAEPPRQIELSGIFRTETTSAVSPLIQLPSTDPWLGPELDRYTAPSVILSSRAVGDIGWKKVPLEGDESEEKCPAYEAPPPRRSPKCSSSVSHYSAEMVASLSATVGCLLVPTFHSCLISRTYSVDLRLSAQILTFGSSSTVRTKVPVLVAYEHTDPRRDSAISSTETGNVDIVRRCDFEVRPNERLTWEEMGASDSYSSPPSYELSSSR